MIVDLGAGTGNFSMLLFSLFSQITLIHIDSSREMDAFASELWSGAESVVIRVMKEPGIHFIRFILIYFKTDSKGLSILLQMQNIKHRF